jgi:hypothetical protein
MNKQPSIIKWIEHWIELQIFSRLIAEILETHDIQYLNVYDDKVSIIHEEA